MTCIAVNASASPNPLARLGPGVPVRWATNASSAKLIKLFMTSGEHELTTSPKNCRHESSKCFLYLEEARKPKLVEKRRIEGCKQQIFRICFALREPFVNVRLQPLGDIGGKSSIIIMPEIFLLQRPPISFLSQGQSAVQKKQEGNSLPASTGQAMQTSASRTNWP